jgi:hypothetical protein
MARARLLQALGVARAGDRGSARGAHGRAQPGWLAWVRGAARLQGRSTSSAPWARRAAPVGRESRGEERERAECGGGQREPRGGRGGWLGFRGWRTAGSSWARWADLV